MRTFFFILAGCTGGAGSAPLADIDSDGYYSDVDCDDTDGLINPGAVELCDGLDNDCDGNIDEEDAIEAVLWFPDRDGDGYGDPTGLVGGCDAPSGYIDNPDDCDDTNSAVNPAAAELCDGIDNNCNELLDEDAAEDAQDLFRDFDGDGYGNPYVTKRQCYPDDDYILNNTDCDDSRSDVNPAAQEVCSGDEPVDEDCDQLYDDEDDSNAPDVTWYLDDDGDGYGDPAVSALACLAPEGFVGNADDCDDTEVTVNPEGVELCADGLDNDCDTLLDDADDSARDVSWFADSDGDGFGDPSRYWGEACTAPAGNAPDDTDCDDSDPSIRPGAAEVWYDGVDQDCAGDDDFDADGDGYPDGEDCDDGNPDVSPGALEVCGDGVDNDCDDLVDPCMVDIEIDGESSGDEAGWSMLLADANGDATADLLIGAPYQDSGATGAGAVYLVSGPVTAGVSLGDATRIDGAAVGDALGWSLAGGADLDGDALDDVVLGAYRLDGAVANLGGAYVLAGPLTGTSGVGDAVATLLGESEGDAAAWALDAGGDLDGDGAADLIISAVDADSGAGMVYALSGPLSGTMRLWGADASFSGESTGDAAGYSVAFGGDLDGDGIDDMLVGAPSHSDTAYEGAAYVVLGSRGLGGAGALADADGTWLGEAGSDEAGHVVAPWADIDGDGLADFLVSAPGVDGDASDTGAVYVVLGPGTGDADLSDSYARIEGRSEDDRAGVSVSAGGDLDGDGIADLLIGAPGTDRVVTGGGAAYLVRGPVSGVSTLGAADGVVYGDGAGDALGTRVLAGDVDGDGVDDALVGSPSAGTGAVWVLLGGGW